MSDIEIGSIWQGKNNEGDVVIVWANHNRVHYDYLNSLGNPMKDVYDVSISHFLEYFEPQTDMVNHPPHYKDASGIECIEVTQHMRFCEGNSFKYVYRAGSKGNLIEDLKKAAWYAERSWTRHRHSDDRIHWLVQRKGEAVADSRDKQGKTFIAEVMRNIVNNRWWQAYDMLMTEIARLEGKKVGDNKPSYCRCCSKDLTDSDTRYSDEHSPELRLCKNCLTYRRQERDLNADDLSDLSGVLGE